MTSLLGALASARAEQSRQHQCGDGLADQSIDAGCLARDETKGMTAWLEMRRLTALQRLDDIPALLRHRLSNALAFDGQQSGIIFGGMFHDSPESLIKLHRALGKFTDWVLRVRHYTLLEQRQIGGQFLARRGKGLLATSLLILQPTP